MGGDGNLGKAAAERIYLLDNCLFLNSPVAPLVHIYFLHTLVANRGVTDKMEG